MAIDYQAISAVRSMQAEVDRYLASLEHDMAHMWGVAWGEISSEFTLAAYDLIDLGDGEWPSRRQILRSQRAANAMKVATDAIQDLARNAAGRSIGNLQTVVDSAERWQRNIITAQLPSPDFLDWARVDSGAVDSIVRRATQRIESTLRPLPADVQAKMKATLIRGVAVGDNPNVAASQMVRKAGEAFDGGLRRARNIARTEMLDAHRASATASRKANSGVLQGWRWLCSLSRRTCPSCLAQNGSLHGVDEPGPLDHQSGRCTAVPTVRGWRDLGIDLDEPPDTFPNAQEWFSRQDRATQVHIMGPERLKRLENGTLSWGQLSTRIETPGWRPSYRITPLGDTGSPINSQLPKPTPSTDPFADLPRKTGAVPDDRESRYLRLLQDDGEIGPPGSLSYERMSDSVRTNPQYAGGKDEYRGNCTHTVTANEFRRRGYDVEASPLPGGKGRSDADWLKARWRTASGGVPDQTPVSVYAPDGRTRQGFLASLLQDLSGLPNGARGVISVEWATGGGHVLNWERDDSQPDGVWLTDPQPGYGDKLARGTLRGSSHRMSWVRLDNLVPQRNVKEFLRARPGPSR